MIKKWALWFLTDLHGQAWWNGKKNKRLAPAAEFLKASISFHQGCQTKVFFRNWPNSFLKCNVKKCNVNWAFRFVVLTDSKRNWLILCYKISFFINLLAQRNETLNLHYIFLHYILKTNLVNFGKKMLYGSPDGVSFFGRMG